jgi:hypothetical protein
MAKYKELKGIAYNLADSFVSATNEHYLRGLSVAKGLKVVDNFQVEFLSGIVQPEVLPQEETELMVKRYQKWLQDELKAKSIPLDMIESVTLNLKIKRSKISVNYQCSVDIKLKTNKTYASKISSSWVW